MKNCCKYLAAAAVCLCGFALSAEIVAPEKIRDDAAKYWDLAKLSAPPAYRPADFADSKVDGMQDILFDGMGPGDKPAPVFAYLSVPSGPVPEGGFPGVVLAHGGGGTAFAEYVRLYNSYGYAVIALDWYNQRPLNTCTPAKPVSVPLADGKRHNNIFNVANIILSHSLLRSLPEVDPDNIALVGLSWGSWYTAMVTAVDHRFKGAVLIYCGDLRNDTEMENFDSMINGRFLHQSKVPMYWVCGATDYHAHPRSLQAAFDEAPTYKGHSMIGRLSHGHGGFAFSACKRYAGVILKGLPAYPKLSPVKVSRGRAQVQIVDPGLGVKRAVLYYTLDGKSRPDKRVWSSIPAEIRGKTIFAKLPEGVRQFFFSAYDETSVDEICCGSSNVFTVK